MTTQLPQLVNGLLMGALYGLIAQGLGIAGGVAKIINIAHGSLLMIGMYLTWWVWTLGLNPYVTAVVVVPAMFGLGYGIQQGLIIRILQREKDRDPVGVLMQTAGIMIVLEAAAILIFTSSYRTIQAGEESLNLGAGVLVPPSKLVAFAISTLVSVLLYWMIQKTDLGRAMRAVGQDRETAKLMGINVRHTYALAMGIGVAIAGLAGVLLAQFFYIYPAVGRVFLLRAFLIVALGGAGNTIGAYVGGIVVGLLESVGSTFIGVAYIEVFIFGLFILLLLVRPKGLLRGLD